MNLINRAASGDNDASNLLREAGIASFQRCAGLLPPVTLDPLLETAEEYLTANWCKFGTIWNTRDMACAYIIYVHNTNGLYPQEWDVFELLFSKLIAKRLLSSKEELAMYPIDPPEYPEYEDNCPYCDHEADSIEFLDVEYDGDESGVYAYAIFKCTACGETFTK